MKSESESRSVMSDSLRPHGLYSPWNFQARILEWGAFPFSRESSQPRDQTQVSCSAGRFCASRDTREAHILHIEVFYLIYDVSVKSPKAAVTKCDKMGRLTNRTILSHVTSGGFPGGSDGKEPTCNVGDLGLISGLGRSLEKGTATHSSILAWKFHRLWNPQGCEELDTTE